jgi:hypothetical protein
MNQTRHAIPYKIKRFPRAGAIDADGHVAEPADLWEKYLEDKYKPRPCGSASTATAWSSWKATASRSRLPPKASSAESTRWAPINSRSALTWEVRLTARCIPMSGLI